MPKYLVKGNYTSEALGALRSAGAASRVKAGQALAASLGGTLECMYWAFGETDVIAITDFPDDQAATAMSVTANADGSLKVSVTKLLTAEEVDESFTRTADYRPPGQ
jgi:uncharacterized protein with GYD domain